MAKAKKSESIKALTTPLLKKSLNLAKKEKEIKAERSEINAQLVAILSEFGVTEITANGVLARIVLRSGRRSVKDLDTIVDVLARHDYVVEDYISKSNDSSYLQVTKA
jgi:hypothetical protein